VAFEGVSARIRRGEVTAVTGPSGSGKTSFVNALLGFVPAEGGMRVGGRDVTGDAAPRAWLAWAGQRAALLEGTVLDNVALGQREPDVPRAREALDLVGGTGIRLDGMIDPRGEGLSGGQSQRVASARAVYRARALDCSVVVFDEPTSALDAETEAEFIRCLRVLADEGRAVIVVSHRPAVIASADAVLRFAGPATAAAGARAEGPVAAGPQAEGRVAVSVPAGVPEVAP
jgi:ATP-binding cassette subfamily C protein CydD